MTNVHEKGLKSSQNPKEGNNLKNFLYPKEDLLWGMKNKKDFNEAFEITDEIQREICI